MIPKYPWNKVYVIFSKDKWQYHWMKILTSRKYNYGINIRCLISKVNFNGMVRHQLVSIQVLSYEQGLLADFVLCPENKINFINFSI